jgi:single-stranded-DNA-specific exonuclease
MILKGLKYEWSYDPPDPDLVEGIRKAAGASDVLASVLASRGVSSPSEAARFLRTDPDSLPDPHLLPDADEVVRRVRAALEGGEKIAVHGHDDADGVTATVIMAEALLQLGASVICYIPDRRSEGHGMNRAELDRLAASGVTLVVTVDSCVSDRDAIGYGNVLGIDTIVTDHHEIPPELPPAVAIVNPKLPESRFPYRYMAGVGVALRVTDLLFDELGGEFGPAAEPKPWYGGTWRDEALGLAAIGSIADKVPLTFDNRTIVVAGTARIPLTERPGLLALLEEARLSGQSLDADDVRSSLGPAFGRVSDGKGGNYALDLLLTSDLDDARERAQQLAQGRTRWRDAASKAWKDTQAAIKADPLAKERPVLIIESTVPVEVMGYVTSRLADETGLPTVLLSDLNGDAMAEARGPTGFNLVDAFHSMSELFLGYGGHPRAAGFTMKRTNVAEFRERMLEFVDENPPTPQPRSVDAELQFDGATPEIARELGLLEPFGQRNPPAALVARGVTLDDYEAARASGVVFTSTERPGREPADAVYRLRNDGETTFANILDVIVPEGPGGQDVAVSE